MASFKADLAGPLKRLEKIFDKGYVLDAFAAAAKQKALAAIIGQGISENFKVEGPGWAPLKAQTIRRSVNQDVKAGLKGLTNKQVEEFEQMARAKSSAILPARKILYRTGLLLNAVTTPGIAGNVWKTEGLGILWGSDLIYARIHNKGGVINWPGTKNGFGKGRQLGPHKITIPKREYLFLNDAAKRDIAEYVAKYVTRVIRARVKAGNV